MARWFDYVAAQPDVVAATGVRDSLRVLPLSAEYLRIRSWAQPAVLLTMVCQVGGWAEREGQRRCSSGVLLTMVCQVGGQREKGYAAAAGGCC